MVRCVFPASRKGLSLVSSSPSRYKLPGCLALRHTKGFGKGAALDFLTGLYRPNVAGTRKKGKERGKKSARRAPAERKKDPNAALGDCSKQESQI